MSGKLKNLQGFLSDTNKCTISSLRFIELLSCIHIERSAHDIEKEIGMDRVTINKMVKRHPDLIEKYYPRVPTDNRGRGRPPVIFRLTSKGRSILSELSGWFKGRG